MTSIPTQGEAYAQLIEHLTKAQECAAMLAHLHNTESKDRLAAQGWLAISEMFKKTKHNVTQFAMRARQ